MVSEPLGSYREQQGQRLFCTHRNLSACFVFKSPSGFWRESSTSDSVLVALAPDQQAFHVSALRAETGTCRAGLGREQAAAAILCSLLGTGLAVIPQSRTLPLCHNLKNRKPTQNV